MVIPFNNFNKEYHAHKKEILPAISKVLESGYFILGKEVEDFEKAFAKYLETKHVIGVANGMEAIQIALMAIGVKRGDEVITTSLSACATALAIKIIGAKPIFVDIDQYYHIDPKEIERKITKKTKAIIPVHIYGQAANMSKIMAIAKKHNLQVIEDCAQAHGAKFKNKKVGSFGIAGCFSFYPTKNLGTYGDGGAIATSNVELANRMRMMRNYGQENRYEHPVIGINSRLDAIHATILSTKLKKLDINNKKRASLAKLYRKELQSVKQIKLPIERKGVAHVYHLFVVEAKKREELQRYLGKKGVATLIHYPIPIHKQRSFREFNSLHLPRLEERTKKILSLPCHPYLSLNEARFISKQIRQFYSLER